MAARAPRRGERIEQVQPGNEGRTVLLREAELQSRENSVVSNAPQWRAAVPGSRAGEACAA